MPERNHYFYNKTLTGESTGYCTVPNKSIIHIRGVPEIDVCYSERYEGDRVIYCNNRTDLEEIASLLEKGVGFRKARKKMGYVGRIKAIEGVEQEGVFFTEPLDAEELHRLTIEDNTNTTEENMELLNYKGYGGQAPHGHISQILGSLPDYNLAMTPSVLPENLQCGGNISIFLKRTDGEDFDMQKLYSLVNNRLHG